ncbi:uncharacterized protein [Coffea arabica]|uniref:Uncharacterized protein isoform X1 n=1 Tax=Coffea arabica TaxID=13443 RepID=A0ABM4UUJ6_COFAR
MNCLNSNPFPMLLFLLSFFIFVNFLSLSYGDSQDHYNLQHASIPELLDTRMHHHAAVEGNTRRIGAETTSQNSTYLILAANRTHRKDPTDSFNYYTGGWNITNPHYIFSVAYSATGPFVFAVVWFIFFAVFLLCFCCRCCFCSRNSYGYSRTAYAVSVTCLAIFTIAAIAGIAFVFAGQDKFQDSIVNTTSFVLHEADDVIVKLGDVLHDLLAAKNSSVGRAVLPDDLKADIDSTGKTINAVTAQFRNITTKNSQDIRSLLSPLYYPVLISPFCVLGLLLISLFATSLVPFSLGGLKQIFNLNFCTGD